MMLQENRLFHAPNGVKSGVKNSVNSSILFYQVTHWQWGLFLSCRSWSTVGRFTRL